MEIIDHIKEILGIISDLVNFIGVLILLFGFSKGVIQFVKNETSRKDQSSFFEAIQNLRSKIGLYILLALDFLIAADIIDSVINQDINELTKLAIAIVIRIAIGYFLGKEIAEIRADNEKRNGHG